MVVFWMEGNCEFRWLGMAALSHHMDAALEGDPDQEIVVGVVAVVVVVEDEVVREKDVMEVVVVEDHAGHAQDQHQLLKAELTVINQDPALRHQSGPKGIRRRELTEMADLPTETDLKRGRGPHDQSQDPDLRRQTTN